MRCKRKSGFSLASEIFCDFCITDERRLECIIIEKMNFSKWPKLCTQITNTKKIIRKNPTQFEFIFLLFWEDLHLSFGASSTILLKIKYKPISNVKIEEKHRKTYFYFVIFQMYIYAKNNDVHLHLISNKNQNSSIFISSFEFTYFSF